MSAIGPGEFVECRIPANRRPAPNKPGLKLVGSFPVEGGIYCVRAVGDYLSTEGMQPGLRLVGIVASMPGHPDMWFPVVCFRPVYRPKPDAFTGLLETPADDLVSA